MMVNNAEYGPKTNQKIVNNAYEIAEQYVQLLDGFANLWF
jgi:hypothetical protein